MVEACIVLSSHFLCRSGTEREADSLVLYELRHLADRGYPFAHAKVWVQDGEYVAIVSRGRFYVIRDPVVVGDASAPLLRWFFKGLYGRAFNLSEVERRSKVAGYYGVEVLPLRRGDKVIFRFRGGGGSVGGEVRGRKGEGISGALTLEGENVLSLGVLLRLEASFDSTDMYLSSDLDVPPLLVAAVRGRASFLRVGDTTSGSVLMVPYVWAYPFRTGVGLGYSSLPFLIGEVGRIGSPAGDVMLFLTRGEVGYLAQVRYGWLSLFAFRGIGAWRERVGGGDRFRKLPAVGYSSEDFAVLKCDVPLLRAGDLRAGPFADLLLEREKGPLWAYGLFATFSDNLSIFLTADGYVGMGVRLKLGEEGGRRYPGTR